MSAGNSDTTNYDTRNIRGLQIIEQRRNTRFEWIFCDPYK